MEVIDFCRKIDASVPLDPEDAALLLDDEVKVKKETSGIRKKDRPTDKGVAWLVKTQYVSPINLDPAKQVNILRSHCNGSRLAGRMWIFGI